LQLSVLRSWCICLHIDWRSLFSLWISAFDWMAGFGLLLCWRMAWLATYSSQKI
jgi:hypothetical protein